MKRPQDLFDLIKSLTPAEKGYFKKYVTQGGDKKYLKLFDAVNDMEEYDEEKLKKKIGDKLSNLSSAKRYLYDEVLDATRHFQLSLRYASQILRLTDQGDLLYRRGLYASALDKYSEAYTMAVDNFDYRNAILPRYGIIQCSFYTGLDPMLPASQMIELDKKIFDEAWLEFAHQELSVMKMDYFAKIGLAQTKQLLDEMRTAEAAHILVVKERTGDSVLGQMLYHSREAYHSIEQNRRLHVVKHCLAGLQLFEDNPTLKTSHCGYYFPALLMLLTAYGLNDLDRERKMLLTHIRKEVDLLKPYMSNTVQRQAEMIMYNHAMVMSIRAQTHSETDKLFGEILPWFETNKKKLPAHDSGRFLLWHMVHLFYKADYRQLVLRCNEYLYDKQTKRPQVDRATVLLMYLVVYLEQNDWDILPAKLREAHRLIKEETTSNESVLLVIRLVEKVIKEKKQFELKPTLLQLQKEMAQRNIDNKTGIVEVFSPFHFEAWIEAKLKGIHHMQAASERNAMRKKSILEKFEEDLQRENLSREDLQLPFMKEAVPA